MNKNSSVCSTGYRSEKTYLVHDFVFAYKRSRVDIFVTDTCIVVHATL